MTTKHTPGQWSVVEHDHAICVQTESPRQTKFGASRYAVVGGFDRSDPEQLEEARANARLIAAAPDLLEALQVMVRDYGAAHASCGDLEMSPALLQAQRAIARATGESK